MFDDLLSEREKSVILLHRGGETFKAIGEKYGITAGRVQAIYAHALEKLRTANDISKRNPEFIRTAKKLKWSSARLFRMYAELKKIGIMYSWRNMTYEDLALTDGIGESYLRFLSMSQNNH